jgi:DEAD/DEAH box helicase domain-containing protein
VVIPVGNFANLPLHMIEFLFIVELDPPLSDNIIQALQSSRKITSLYSHQVEAISAIHRGRNVIVSTATASGKSVIYQVPLLRFLEEDRESTALFVYPTKVWNSRINHPFFLR